jgi:peptidoglycan hydrolase-like protein with peptidoglycan-binding domain
MRTARGVAFASLLAVLVAATAAPAGAGVQVPGLQVALKARGLYAGPIDGIAGQLTKRGVRSFQRRSGLAVDGIAGPRTRAKLGRLGRPNYGRRMIRHGMVGWDVSVLQFLLARRGVAAGGIDGIFGPGTHQAVRRFQARSGLLADGIVGPVTRQALKHGGPRKARRSRGPVTATQVRAALGRWANHYGMSPSFVRSIAWVESGYQPHVVSPVGARGVMQVMPATWRFVEDVLVGRNLRHTTTNNIKVGILYLRHMYRLFGGNKRLTVGAYYQGPKAVRRYGLFRETRVYVRTVLAVQRSMIA